MANLINHVLYIIRISYFFFRVFTSFHSSLRIVYSQQKKKGLTISHAATIAIQLQSHINHAMHGFPLIMRELSPNGAQLMPVNGLNVRTDFNFGKKISIILFKLMAVDSEYDWDLSDDGDVTFLLFLSFVSQ